MSGTQYYKWSLALPILLPLLVSPLQFAGPWVPSSLKSASEFLTWSLVFGGIPYVLLAFGLVWWMRGKGEATVRRASFIVPLLMLAIFWVCWFAYALVPEPHDIRASYLLGGVAMSLYVVVVGYAYVMLITLSLDLLRRLGAVK